MNDKTLQVRIPQSLWDEIKKKAKWDGVTPSAYVRRLLKYYVMKGGE